jgi:hypothetical protein
MLIKRLTAIQQLPDIAEMKTNPFKQYVRGRHRIGNRQLVNDPLKATNSLAADITCRDPLSQFECVLLIIDAGLRLTSRGTLSRGSHASQAKFSISCDAIDLTQARPVLLVGPPGFAAL